VTLLEDPATSDAGFVTAGTVAPPDEDRPRRIRQADRMAAGELLGSALASLSLTWLLFYRLTSLHGATGFAVWWLVSFFVVYWLVVYSAHGTLRARDRMAAAVVGAGAILTLIPLVLIITYVITRGLEALRWGFFVEDMATTGPSDPLTQGGVFHSIVGTLQQVGIAIVISVPLGVLTAVFLNEVGGRTSRLARLVRIFVDAMSGLPSIVAGLFIYAVWILRFNNGFSGFAAAVALSVLMLPTITRTTEEMLRLVPGGLREASLALGGSEWKTTFRIVLPTARTGIVTAVILGTARAIGETAPVLLTAFGASVLNANPFSGAQDDLPLFVYTNVRSSQDAAVARAWTAALVLILLVMFLFVLARIVGGARIRGRQNRALFGPLAALYRREPGGDGFDPVDDADAGDWNDTEGGDER
jgi:phosphate transport system permease protein